MIVQLYCYTTLNFAANVLEFLVIFMLKYEHDIYFLRIRLNYRYLPYYKKRVRHEKSRCDTKVYNINLKY
jgi:hypothetical protein